MAGRGFQLVSFAFMALLCASAWSQAPNPRHIDLDPTVTSLRTLSQNWSNEEANWFYNVPQGSRLLPYKWFLHLEMPNSAEQFRSAENIRRLGYIPRLPDSDWNPDGLPIGFVRDADYSDGTAGLGLTCAACHTTQINYGSTAILIDGGPTMGDFGRFMRELAASLTATAANDEKFSRFADAVLPDGASEHDRLDLRMGIRRIAQVRSGYNERNLPGANEPPFGPGRVDAFGAIFNEVAVTFLNRPANWQAADAPVSYPCLWDAPQHDAVQWNGAAKNLINPLGELLVGTKHIGALGRNAGEVLGVFGSVHINPEELVLPRRYESTVNTTNLIQIEESLTTLWSPEWPEDVLGPINEADRDAGRLIYKSHCKSCHQQDFDRTDPNRSVTAKLDLVGTDMNMLRNFGRTADTGVLQGRQKTLFDLSVFGERDSIGEILRHVVQRAILSPSLDPRQIKSQLNQALASVDRGQLLNQLNPGFRMTGRIDLGDQELIGEFDAVLEEGASVLVEGGLFQLVQKGGQESVGSEMIDLRSADGIRAVSKRLKQVALNEASNLETPGASPQQPVAAVHGQLDGIGYKARPLNGIWATAPYLHNGSVPSLKELLKPESERNATFHVGSLSFDPVSVGYEQDASSPLFDTRKNGNLNSGHEFGTGLSATEKRQLIEYLKSL